jgi:hypothetical protein
VGHALARLVQLLILIGICFLARPLVLYLALRG